MGSEMCIRDRPTYLLVNDPEGEFEIIGELKGGIAKGDFRERLSNLITN